MNIFKNWHGDRTSTCNIVPSSRWRNSLKQQAESNTIVSDATSRSQGIGRQASETPSDKPPSCQPTTWWRGFRTSQFQSRTGGREFRVGSITIGSTQRSFNLQGRYQTRHLRCRNRYDWRTRTIPTSRSHSSRSSSQRISQSKTSRSNASRHENYVRLTRSRCCTIFSPNRRSTFQSIGFHLGSQMKKAWRVEADYLSKASNSGYKIWTTHSLQFQYSWFLNVYLCSHWVCNGVSSRLTSPQRVCMQSLTRTMTRSSSGRQKNTFPIEIWCGDLNRHYMDYEQLQESSRNS